MREASTLRNSPIDVISVSSVMPTVFSSSRHAIVLGLSLVVVWCGGGGGGSGVVAVVVVAVVVVADRILKLFHFNKKIPLFTSKSSLL